MRRTAAGRPPARTGEGPDRRAEPRLALEAPVVVQGPGSCARGRTLDASSIGLLVELDGALPFLAHEVGVLMTLADGSVATLEADVVRRSLSDEGRVMLALRLAEAPGGRALRRGATAGPRPGPARPRPSRAKPRAPRPAPVVRQEIHALGTRVLELAIVEPDAAPPEAMVRWLGRLAAEAGLRAPLDLDTNRQMVREIAGLYRRSAEAEAAEPMPSARR
jgi:hypothetical protein